MSTTGVLVANKPRGMTSHDVVIGARRIFATRAVGHAGTLDPMASGVLVLLFGEATKLAGYLTAADKEYRATVTFGRATDTLDADGRTTLEQPLEPNWLDHARLLAAIDVERARTMQEPPEYSAISIGGERSHRRARRGESVSLPPRSVGVERLELTGRSDWSLTFVLTVSKGYYVRAFARDLGGSLGVPAHLTELVRLGSGPFRLDEATAWPPAAPPALIPVAAAVRRSMPCATLTSSGIERAARGQRLAATDFQSAPPTEPSAWLTTDETLVAVGTRCPDGTFRVIRGFHGRA